MIHIKHSSSKHRDPPKHGTFKHHDPPKTVHPSTMTHLKHSTFKHHDPPKHSTFKHRDPPKHGTFKHHDPHKPKRSPHHDSPIVIHSHMMAHNPPWHTNYDPEAIEDTQGRHIHL